MPRPNEVEQGNRAEGHERHQQLDESSGRDWLKQQVQLFRYALV